MIINIYKIIKLLKELIIFGLVMFALGFWAGKARGEEIVVQTIAYEASSEPLEAQIMVAQCILTRAKERNLTLEAVVTQPYQFSCNNKSIRQKMKKRTDREIATRSLS